MPSPNPDPPSTVILRAERLTLLRGGRAVVKDVDLTLEPGARVGVMGPSGAGKSSLARMLVGET
ncbi:MAG: ATP-binding cassette domain-containing protein, partial [Myxococcota bacterium]